MPESAPFLSDTLVAELLLQLRADRVRKREFISSLTEGVVLAVEQVQEVRLASLEAGPETSGTGLIADAFWGFLFDSGINALWSRMLLGGFLRSMEKFSVGLLAHEMHLAKTARETTAPLKALRSALYGKTRSDVANSGVRKGDRALAERLVTFLDGLDKKTFDKAGAFRQGTIDIRSLLDKEIKNSTRESRTGIFTFALFAHDLRVRNDKESTGSTADGVAVAVEQLLSNTRAYLSGSSTPDLGGTPAMNLLASTYDWASRQRQQLELMSDRLEVSLMQSHHVQSMAGICLALGVTSDSVPMDLGAVRARAWLLSEAVVWAEVYRAELCGRTQVVEENDQLVSIGIPERTAAYLEKRFASDARTWIVSSSSSTTLVPPASKSAPTMQRATAENSTPMSEVRLWAGKRLSSARDMLRQEPTLMALQLTAENRAAFRKMRVDSFAVAAFLLGMLNCYQRNASFLADEMTALREELKN
jgi:hypothetical protein